MVYYHTLQLCGKVGPRCFHNKPYTHLTADTEQELVDFATGVLGMKRSWLQLSSTPRFHFDVTGRRLKALLASAGASQLSAREWVGRQKVKRGE